MNHSSAGRERCLDIEHVRTFGLDKFFIGGVLHCAFRSAEFAGLQSWIESANAAYSIEITLRGGAVITLEYDSAQKWEKMLDLLGFIDEPNPAKRGVSA